MRDDRDPTHVYLDIMEAKTSWNEGILAAADRVEKDRRAGAERVPPGAPELVWVRGYPAEVAPQNGGKTPQEHTGEQWSQ